MTHTNNVDYTDFQVDGGGNIEITPSGGDFLITGNVDVGINTATPDARLEILDASNPQLRLTHTDSVDYVDFQTDTSGDMTITLSGTQVKIAGNLNPNTDDTYDLGSSSLQWNAGYIEHLTVGPDPTSGDADIAIKRTGSGDIAKIEFHSAAAERATISLDASDNLEVVSDNDIELLSRVQVDSTLRLINADNPAAGEGLELQYSVGSQEAGIIAYDRGGAAYVDLKIDAAEVWINSSSAGVMGVGTNNPARTFEVLDASNPQIRLTHTDNTDYADLQVDTDGQLSIAPSGGDIALTPDANGDSRFTINRTADTDIAQLNFDTNSLNRARLSLDSSDNTVFYTDGQLHISTGGMGINTTHPDRSLDILQSSNPQLRLTQSDGVDYTDFQTDGDGYLAIAPSGGIITFSGQSAVSVYLSLDQGILDGIAEIVEFDTVVYDTQNEFNTGTYTFTAKAAGIYSVKFQIHFQGGAAGDFLLVKLYQNAALKERVYDSTPTIDSHTVTGSKDLELAATDTITITVENDDNNDFLSGGQEYETFMTISKIH